MQSHGASVCRVAPRSACLVALTLSITTISCTSSPTRDEYQNRCEPRNGRPDPSAQSYGDTDPGYRAIRLTDDGELTDRCAWTEALFDLKSTPGQLVVVYVHGWKHSDDSGDDNVQQFKKLLDGLHDLQQQNASPRRVLGIYVAWRGGLTPIPVVKEFTFWSRKKAAGSIAQSAIVTKLLAGIDNIVEQKADEGQPRDRVIYMGHSFGARILFQSALQRLVTEVEFAHSSNLLRRRNRAHHSRRGDFTQYEPIRGAGDLVILVNPAFEASFYTTLESYQRDESFHPKQKPLLLSFSAKNDLATGVAFPLGQMLGLNFSEKRRTTLGHYAGFRTHVLLDADKSADCKGSTGAPAWYDSWCTASVCLVHSNETKMFGNPFVVAEVRGSAINGHNDFWTEEFGEFLATTISKIDDIDVPAFASPLRCRSAETN
jgi:hypothetical protein